ncbi:MAG TPA: beta-ketoacyl synthase chain length factor [Mycobacteriales bacterium]|nr:beta-ketoacyl synthase chain length factor [Mycobacteriales bacterium]
MTALADHLLLPGGGGPVVLARSSWPAGPDDTLTPVAGFTLSTFSPLVAEVAERCLRARYGSPPAVPDRAGETALVLASARGDVTTTETAAAAAEAGRRVPPLLFFQSNPNAVLGWVAARWQLTGPVLSTAPAGDPLADGIAVAELLLADGEAAEVLVIAAELDPDRAEAVLVGRAVEMSLVLPAEDPATAAGLIVPDAPPAAAAELIVTDAPAPAAAAVGAPAPAAAELIVPDAPAPAGAAGELIVPTVEGDR